MRRGRVVAATILAVVVVAGAAWGAMDTFLKFDDLGLQGESQDDKHKGEIDVISWSWSVKNTGSFVYGGGSGTGKAEFSDLAVRKFVDKASPNLFLYAATGQHIKSAILTVRKAGIQQQEFYKLYLYDILVTSFANDFDHDSAAGGLPELFSLNFSKIEMGYRPQNTDGTLGAEIKTGFDIKQNLGL